MKQEQVETSKNVLGKDTADMLLRVHEDAIWILESIGVGCKHPDILKAFEKFEEEGLAISFEDRIYITADLLTHCLGTVPGAADFFVPRNSFFIRGGASGVRNDVDGAGTMRPSAGHAIRIAKAAGQNGAVDGLGGGVGLKSDVLQMGLMAEHCKKPLCLSISSEAGLEKAKALHEQRKNIIAEFPLLSPLETGESLSDVFVGAVKAGLPVMISSSPLAGADAPFCYNGVLAMAHAGVLFGICAAQLLSPGAVCIHGGSPGIADPQKDFAPVLGSASHSIANILMAHLSLMLDIPACQSTGASDAKAGKALCLKYGAHMMRHSFGFLENLEDFSLAKLEKDMEAAAGASAQDAPDVDMPVYDERGGESLRRNEAKSYKADALTKENTGKVFAD